MDLKKGQKNSSSGGLPDTGDKEPQMSFKPAPQGPLPSDVPNIDAPAGLMAEKPGAKPTGETTGGSGMEEKPRREGTDDTVPAMTDGSIDPTPDLTLDEKAAFIRETVFVTVANASDRVGEFLGQTEFEGDYKKALSKDPYKGTSLNELGNHKDQPLSRQRLAECVRGYAVGTEMEEELGMERDSIDFYKRVEISRIINRDDRMKLILMAEAQKLTVKEIREEVKRQTRKVVSTDRDLSEAVMKQLMGGRLAGDQDIRDFLLDKDRLKARVKRW